MHYVIGDVHGCYTSMIKLIEKLEKLDSDAKLLFVGDFVDRGPEVDKVIQWMMKNITMSGKYQSVRGNHEQMAIDWYWQEFLPWWQDGGFEKNVEPMPESNFDFSKWMKDMGCLSPEKIEPIVRFFGKLPLGRKLQIQTQCGKEVTYHIVHAWICPLPNASVGTQKNFQLWERQGVLPHDFEGIVVHGHTPTILHDYWRQGMIGYGKQEINVDTGACFAGRMKGYPCSLGAICLETLEEFYAEDVQERLGDAYERYMEEFPIKKDIYRNVLLSILGYEKVEGSNMLGEPKYAYNELVHFRFRRGEEWLEKTGRIRIIDEYGTFADPSDVSYDILVEEENCLYKHVKEQYVTKA